jgi:superfamily I DNA/RNA helicase
MSNLKKEAATNRENYITAIRLIEDAIEYRMIDSIESAYALLEKGVTGENTLRLEVGLNKAQIKSLKSMPKPTKVDQNQQKRMVLIVKSLKVYYDAIVASHNNPDPSLSEAVSDLQDSIKKLDVQHNVFFDVQRDLISAISNNSARTQISRLLKTVRGNLNNVREIAYAARATHVTLNKIKNTDLQEVKDVFDNARVKELRSLTDAPTLTDIVNVSTKTPPDGRSKALIKSMQKVAEAYGSPAKTASESAEVRGLLKSLKENRESGASLPEILREQNNLIEEAQTEGNLDSSIVEVIKVLNEAKVLVTDAEHKTDIGGDLGLTREQEDAMLSDGMTIISAGAGSGKTRVLSGKVAHLIKDKGADPYSILACSFSRKSASDLKKKIEDAVGRSLKNIEYTTIGRTTHSIAIEFINRFDPSAGVKKIVDEYDLLSFVQRAVKLAKDTPNSGSRPKSDSFWSEKMTPMSASAERDDIRVLSMIYTVENWREEKGYEKENVSSVVLGIRESYKKNGVGSVTTENVSLIDSILKTSRGEKILARAFGGNQEKIDSYSFPSAVEKKGKKASTESAWWGIMGMGSQGAEIKIPSAKKCQLFITKCKARMLSPSEAWVKVSGKGDLFEMQARVYGAYQHLLNIDDRMDFDDVLIKATRLLSYKKNLDEIRAQYKHIIVDEAQDLNLVQHAFFGMIAGTYSAKGSNSKPVPVKAPVATQGTSFTLIGDENQSIYGFRGATSQEFTSKSKTNQGSFDLMSIGLNFRSGENIVSAANRLASKGLGLSCVASFKGSQDSIKHERKKNANESARSLASDIKTAITSSVQTSTPSDFGIACRTNAEVIPYALALLEQDIPFVSGVDPFNHTSTKSIIRVMGASSSDVSLRMSALFNSWRDFGYDFPSSFNGKTLGKVADSFKVKVEDLPDHIMDQVDEGQEDNFYTLLEALGIDSKDKKKNEIFKYLEMLAHWGGEGTARPKEAFDIALGYKPIYEGDEDFYVEGPNGKKLHEILASKVKASDTEYLSKMVSDGGGEIEPSVESEGDSQGDPEEYNLAPLPSLRSLFNKHESVQEALDKIKVMKSKAKRGFAKSDEDAVVLDTVHGWKGLEVPNLYVPMIEGKFPSDKVDFDPIIHANEAQAQADKAEQEQKLAYVAVTRGMKSVTVLSYEQNEKGEELEPSEFIGKMGLDCGSKTGSTKLATALEILSEDVTIEDDDMTDAEIDEALSLY